MKIYYDERYSKENIEKGGRPHPYAYAAHDPRVAYYDFVRQPHLIRESLEDLLSFATKPATETFYDLLEWLNGDDSHFETNDVAFNFGENVTQSRNESLQAHGRIMLFLRDKMLNFDDNLKFKTEECLWNEILGVDQNFDFGFVGFAHCPANFTELPPPLDLQRFGQLQIHFWAWGNTEAETFENLDRLLKNLHTAFQKTNETIFKPH